MAVLTTFQRCYTQSLEVMIRSWYYEVEGVEVAVPYVGISDFRLLSDLTRSVQVPFFMS
jgi:hypothetical protein